MPRGGRRFGDGAPAPAPVPVPDPPASVVEAEREAWAEVAAQVAAAGTYTAADYSSFRLAVKALAAVYSAPLDLKPTSMKGLIENASKMLSRFGLDPVARGQVTFPEPDEPEEDELSEFE